MTAKTYNGKPLSYWETEARALVVDILVRAGTQHAPTPGGPRSIISEIASQQLLALATGVDPRLATEAAETLDRLGHNMTAAVAAIVTPPRRNRRKP